MIRCRIMICPTVRQGGVWGKLKDALSYRASKRTWLLEALFGEVFVLRNMEMLMMGFNEMKFVHTCRIGFS